VGEPVCSMALAVATDTLWVGTLSASIQAWVSASRRSTSFRRWALVNRLAVCGSWCAVLSKPTLASNGQAASAGDGGRSMAVAEDQIEAEALIEEPRTAIEGRTPRKGRCSCRRAVHES
jgi:hypothetical protein